MNEQEGAFILISIIVFGGIALHLIYTTWGWRRDTSAKKRGE